MTMRMIRDNFQNFKRYSLPKAQLIIADIPYNIGKNAYASSPEWYKGGDNKNGESNKAKSNFFRDDDNFRVPEFMHFCTKMLRKEPKGKNQAGCIIIFCAFEQQFMIIDLARKYGFLKYINLVFYKNYSAQVLKANMRIVGNCEYAVLLYRDKLPKFNNDNKMIFNAMRYQRDTTTPKIHPTQKSVPVLENLISIFTDPGDVIIDPTAGSGATLLAAENLGREAYGFEIQKKYVDGFNNQIAKARQTTIFNYLANKKMLEDNQIKMRMNTEINMR